jgi:hypothetical protein
VILKIKAFPSREVVHNLAFPLAKHEDSTRGLSLNKNDDAGRKNRGMFYLVESVQRCSREGAEEIVGTQVTRKTFCGHAVGRVHGCSLFARYDARTDAVA